MLRSKRLADIIATLIMSCFAIAGWMQLHSEMMASVESKSPDLFEGRLCRNDYGSTVLNKTNITTFTDCSGFEPMLAKSIAINSFDQKVEDVFNLKKLSNYQHTRSINSRLF